MYPLYLSCCITTSDEVAVRATRTSTSTNILMMPYAPLEIFYNLFSYRPDPPPPPPLPDPPTWNAIVNVQLLTVLRKLLECMCSFNRSLIMCCFNHQRYNMLVYMF